MDAVPLRHASSYDPMPNLVTGRQLRAARVLAGLTQREFARAVGVHERSARYWELKDQTRPTSTAPILEKIEAVLRAEASKCLLFLAPGFDSRCASPT